MSTKFKGFIYGVGTAVTFGLIPLFTLPLMREGMQSDSILFYRFLVSTVALGLMMIAKRESFAIAWGDLPVMLLLWQSCLQSFSGIRAKALLPSGQNRQPQTPTN